MIKATTKHITKCTIALLAIVICLCSCGNRHKKTVTAEPVSFPMPSIPKMYTSQEAVRDFLKLHYWDKFDFSQTDTPLLRDTSIMVSAFANYIALISDNILDSSPIAELMSKAAGSKGMLDYFKMLTNEVINDPNSPLRNDEFYIPVLETMISSGFYSGLELEILKEDLSLISENRLGHKANNFSYIDTKGKKASLYDINADFTLIFFNNPGCSMCRLIREDIGNSQLLSAMIEDGTLKVLSLYPDEDLAEWHNYKSEIPSDWINAYDKGTTIRNNNLYNLNAIPSLYLLDSQKTVIVKDGTEIGQLESVIFSHLNN